MMRVPMGFTVEGLIVSGKISSRPKRASSSERRQRGNPNSFARSSAEPAGAAWISGRQGELVGDIDPAAGLRIVNHAYNGSPYFSTLELDANP
jgi:hypothetical protein